MGGRIDEQLADEGGRLALARAAPASALVLLDRALAMGSSDAVPRLKSALEASLEPRARAQIARALGGVLVLAGQVTDALDVLERAVCGAVAIFDRAANGAVTQKTGTAGCISDATLGDAGCAPGRALLNPWSVTVSPDGQSLYVGASRTTAILDRETADVTPPETTIMSGPAQGSTTNSSTPTFAFSSSEAGSTFECRVDAQPFVPCSSPYTAATLAAGQHTFEVRATDAANNVDATPASRTFTVATPLVPIAAITGLRLSPTTFPAAVRPGSGVTYTLNVAALVRFTVERSGRGRRVGGSCVKQTASIRRRPSCARYVRVPGSFSRNRPAGADRFRFTARVAGRTLKPGRYRLVVTPAANGRTGTPSNTRFRIVR